MKYHSRLKHAAAGMLGSLVSRNNDVNGHWAPGLLYCDASEQPHVVQLDLLTQAVPAAGRAAELVAVSYAQFLRLALEKHDIGWEELTLASVRFEFNVQVSDPQFSYPCPGDPFICSVSLCGTDGRIISISARARCRRYVPGIAQYFYSA